MIVDALCACRFRRLVLIHPIDDGIHQIRIDLQEFEEPLDPLNSGFLGNGVSIGCQVVQIQLASFIFDLAQSAGRRRWHNP